MQNAAAWVSNPETPRDGTNPLLFCSIAKEGTCCKLLDVKDLLLTSGFIAVVHISGMPFQKIHGTKCLEFSHSQLCTKKTFTTMTMKVDYALGMVVEDCSDILHSF